jgi:hypothetical protein
MSTSYPLACHPKVAAVAKASYAYEHEPCRVEVLSCIDQIGIYSENRKMRAANQKSRGVHY